MASVQFYGASEVLEHARMIGIPTWSISIGGKLFTKWEGTDIEQSMEVLLQFLDKLEGTGSTGVYTLKFFELKPDGAAIKITEKSTVDGGSFNFKLIDQETRDNRRLGMVVRDSQHYETQIAALRAELEELREEREDPAPSGIGAIGMDLLKNPQQLAGLVNVGRVLLGLPSKDFGNLAALGSLMTGAAPADGQAINQANQDPAAQERIFAALDTLGMVDPNLAIHLEKLASMAKNNPAQFNSTVGMLDMMP